jgi:hypothetical protein
MTAADPWDAELDDFEARLTAAEASLASGQWVAPEPWAPPVALGGRPATPAQRSRALALVERSDRVATALGVAVDGLATQLDGARKHRTASRHYLRADLARH